ncbi:MAG: hypothetical protein KME20_16785 [Kaiparowitsia implicata GSE-PSE-MK54-09C]|nr:hypothetical protein [Kaiparowitsia implicata GSE-PSE-MK54-09C]
MSTPIKLGARSPFRAGLRPIALSPINLWVNGDEGTATRQSITEQSMPLNWQA